MKSSASELGLRKYNPITFLVNNQSHAQNLKKTKITNKLKPSQTQQQANHKQVKTYQADQTS